MQNQASNTDSSIPEKLDFSPGDESLNTNMSSLSLGPPSSHARSGSSTTFQSRGFRPPTGPRAMRTRSFSGLSVNTSTPPVANGPPSCSYPPSRKPPHYTNNNPRQYSPVTPSSSSYSSFLQQQQINSDVWHHGLPKPPRTTPSDLDLRLAVRDLQAGLIVYVIPNGDWHGGHPGIVRSWDDEGTAVSIVSCTSLGGKSLHIMAAAYGDDEKRDKFLRTFLLVRSADTDAEPHLDLPVLNFKDGRSLNGKTTYAKFEFEYEVDLQGLERWPGRHVVENMETLEQYFKVRLPVMRENAEAKAARAVQEEKEREAAKKVEQERAEQAKKEFKDRILELARKQKEELAQKK